MNDSLMNHKNPDYAGNLQVSVHPFWKFEIDVQGVDVVRWDLRAPAPQHLDIVVTSHWASPSAVVAAHESGARLLQIGSIGYDAIPLPLQPGLRVANATTVHETSTAEHVMALLLAGMRNIAPLVRGHDAHRWERMYSPGLADRRVLVLGAGAVARAIIARLQPFEVELTVVASRERDEAFGHVCSLEQLPSLLPEQDVVIAVLPATSQTTHLVDDAFLAQMKDGAVFLNAGRGSLAATEALVRHADRLQILLDVTDPEPLPPDSPLWDAASLITSHNAGNSFAMHRRMKALVERQIAHALAGEDFENLVL